VSGYGAEGAHGEESEPIISDKWRVDPVTGEVREPRVGGFPRNPFAGKHAADPGDPNNASQPLSVDLSAAELDLAKQEAAERTADFARGVVEARPRRARRAVVAVQRGEAT
jgi:molecular chaperone GrpE